MSKDRDKKIDELLGKVMREEALKIKPPSSHELWASLEERLHEHARPQKDPAQKAEQSGGKWAESPLNRLWRRYKPLAAIAAALIAVIVITHQVPQASALRSYVINIFAGVDENKVELEMSTKPMELDEKAAVPPPEDKALQREYMPAEAEEFPACECEEEALQPEEQLILMDDTEEMEWFEQHSFTAALYSYRDLAPESFLALECIPAGFTFERGSIVKTEEFIMNMRCEYSNGNGGSLSITQNFHSGNMAAAVHYSTADGSAEPFTVGPYSGYIIRGPRGFNTATWLQEYSIVTISGRVEVEVLQEIVSCLETR